jgi:metallo-beta-lactamase family protein
VAFVGYQVPGTLGHKLLGGADSVRLFGEDVLCMARIANLPGLSGHADRDGLIRWISAFKKPPKKVFVVHGDDLVVDEYAKLVTEKTGFVATAPYSGDAYDLITGEQISYGSKTKKEHHAKSKGARANLRIYDRLLATGQRMLTVIRKNQGLNNKDMAKFADQLAALCDKWDRKD